MIIAKSQFFSVPFDRKYIIRREICNFPPQKSKFLPQNHRKKFENWKLKIHVKFFGALEFSTDHFFCFGITYRSLKKGKGLNYPQVYSHWPTPSNPAFWLVVTSHSPSFLLVQNPRQLRVAANSRWKVRWLLWNFPPIIFWTNRKTEALKYCVLIGPPPTHAPFKMIGR